MAAAATAAALTMTGCTVEIVDDGPSGRTLTSDPPRPAPPTGGEPQEPTEPEESTEPVEPEPDDEASEPAPDQGASVLPTREDLLPLTTAQTACGGGDLTRDRAGDAVEITDACSTLTLGGASSVVVAGEVTDLVVTASGVRVAVQRVARVTISAANVTVTWEDGSPIVTDEGPGNTYGSVDLR